MEQHIEIEFKNLLTQEHFKKLINFFQPDSFVSQENYYFDTALFELKKQASALRIREKNQKFELTLKQPSEVGLLESNQLITKQFAEAFIQNGSFPTGSIQELIVQAGLDPKAFTCFGSLRTERAEIEYHGGIIVLDHSFYAGKEDYELEYEVEDAQLGKKIFMELLEKLEIPLQKTENKIKRFYQATIC